MVKIEMHHKFLYSIAERISKRNISRLLKNILVHDSWSKKEIKEFQLKKLREILIFSYKNIPYYQKLFNSCKFNPEEFYDLKQMESIPYLTKEIIKENENLFLKQDNFIVRKTGGSTGSKLTIFYDLPSLDLTAAVHLRCMEWAGKKAGQKEIHFSSAVHDHIPWKDNLLEILKCKALNRVNITIDLFNEENIEEILIALKKVKPVLVQGFPSIAYELAKYAQKKGMEVQGIFKIYESTGETLYDFQREKIENIFRCEVFNRYGNAEFGVIAHECKLHQGMHIHEDIVFVETVSLNEMSHEEEIVVTTLTNKAMPLIRYRTGDLGCLEKDSCKCGLPYSKIKKMQGRVHDFLVLENDKKISTSFFLDLMDKCGGVENFQIRNNYYNIELYIIPQKDCNIESFKIIRSEILKKIPLKKIDIYLVDRLNLTPSGKYRYLINNKPDYDQSYIIFKDYKGRLYDCIKSSIFPHLAGIICVEGFYKPEYYESEIFINTKCKGSFYLTEEASIIQLLGLIEEQELTMVTLDRKKEQKILLKRGWNEYKIVLPENEIINFTVNKAIPFQNKEQDNREIGIGIREILK